MRRDEALLLDMLLAARDCRAFTSGKSFEDLQGDRMLQFALFKLIEILGEAAARISVDLQGAHPEIPWSRITGMRHRLVHAYFDVNLEIVHEVVERDLPELIRQLERLVPPEVQS
ncbi:MAG: HepT-like ribonuclease domain-containing protein [Thermoanaerobaculia bacterium]